MFTWPLLGAVLPFFAGLFIGSYGYASVFLVGLLALLVGTYLSRRMRENERIEFHFWRAFESLKGIKSLMLLEGLWQGVNWSCFVLITVFFIKDELQFGAFMSLMGVAGGIAALLLARISDKIQNRSAFAGFSAIGLSLSTIASGMVGTLWLWGVTRGINAFFERVAIPFMWTVVADARDARIADAMIGREFLLNAGRVAGILLIVTLLLLLIAPTGGVSEIEILRTALIISGIVYLAYPVVLHRIKL
jgi:MFS family permease